MKDENNNERSEVLTVMVMKSPILWEVTPCSLMKVNVFKELTATIFRVEQKPGEKPA